jgi:hypothetical protein
MSIFQTYLENSGSNTQRILDYLSKNAERIDQRPEIKKLLEEIKVQVSKIRTTQTGEKFISEGMRENLAKSKEQLVKTLTGKICGWYYGEAKGFLEKSNFSLKKLNEISGTSISESRAEDIIMNNLMKELSSAKKKPNMIVETTKNISKATKELLKIGKIKFEGKNKTLLDFDFIYRPIRNKIERLSVEKQLELYKKLSGKDYTYNEKDFENTPKAIKATIQKILKEQK